MKPAPFRYLRPDTIAEAVDVLGRYGEEARVLAGGQSLGAMLNLRLATPAVLVDILGIEALRHIEDRGAYIAVGATVGQTDAINNALVRDRLPLLALALPFVGHYQTRNRGTVGGSVAHADPSAEIPLALLALGGAVLLQSRRGTREVAADAFFRGPLVTARRADEIVVETRWPAPAGHWGYAFQEMAIREGDFAITASACAVRLADDGAISQLAIGYAGVGDRPLRADTGPLLGARPRDVTRADVAGLAVPDVRPRDDLHATAAYRRHLVGLLGWRALRAALTLAQENPDA